MKKELISAPQILVDHGLEMFSSDEFIKAQKRALNKYILYPAHNAKVEIIEEGNVGLLLVKKTFGIGERRIPFHVAEGLCDDYALHERRLKDSGIRIAENYGMKLYKDGEYGTITVQQLFFPQGTLIDWLKEGRDTEEVVRSSIQDTLMPVLKCNPVGSSDDESWVFLDNAPKNVAPIKKPNGEIDVFYFDFFVPRVRNEDGSIKVYDDFNFHIRPEEEMRDRFFTLPGIINNFLQKTRTDLIDLPDIWRTFSLVSQWEIGPFLKKYFPNQEIDNIARAKYSRSNVIVR